MSKLSLIIAFLLSAFTGFFFASIFHTQFVLAALIDINIAIDFSTRISMTVNDLIGLLLGYGSIILIGLAIAFTLITPLYKLAKLPLHTQYPVAGVIAFACMLALMEPLLGITLIAGARTWLGIFFQCLAGFIAGIVFQLRQNRLKNHCK